ncbi:putative phenylalanine--tRNA ligase beta subunit-like [Tropilaelaps mercedesae]|uniref:Phenylalanine--tRNA ligase beta subunit n=1 Tax=Tropilaelaps mercedesae TaxID=418985 RepID=A0A1V9XMP8_9ACAR|nr:putative phenylalanine--tRNA ligase beta subunit-like [Tropilaelaps mercedesae]
MPTIGVNAELLFKAMGRPYTEKEFADLCFDYGLELDEVTSAKKLLAREQGEEAAGDTTVSDYTIYKIDIPANRYDILCLEGLARSLLIFQGKIPVPRYELITPATPLDVVIMESTKLIRPFFVGAVLRNISFTKESYDSFIDLQDKLHHNIGRKRRLVSIGTHDLDTIEGPFMYDALPPEKIKFVPLYKTEEYTGAQLMDLYAKDSHLRFYLPIIQDSPVFPVVLDARGIVCSMPPIINSEHTKITLRTKNVFIEITALDEHKASIVLDTIVTMFSEYCGNQFTIEQVNCIRPDGSSSLYPKLPYRKISLCPQRVNRILGTKLETSRIAELLSRMSLETKVSDEGSLNVMVPPTRHDIIHPVDVIEDVGIAHGYNNIERLMPPTVTTGGQLPLNKLSDQLRENLAQSGFTEVFTFSLCARDDISTKILHPGGCSEAVHVSNPKTLEFQVARTRLLPGLLKTLNCNKKMPLPLRLFEISDVVKKSLEADVGAKNQRNLCAVYYGKVSGFELIHGLLDRVMCVLNVPYVSQQSERKATYQIKPANDNMFLSGRCAEIFVNGVSMGFFGVLHPTVLANFDLALPVSALELSIEIFV